MVSSSIKTTPCVPSYSSPRTRASHFCQRERRASPVLREDFAYYRLGIAAAWPDLDGNCRIALHIVGQPYIPYGIFLARYGYKSKKTDVMASGTTIASWKRGEGARYALVKSGAITLKKGK